MIHWILAIALCIPLMAVEKGSPVEYVGGTLDSAKAGNEGALVLSNPQTLELHIRGTNLLVPYDRVNLIEYGQNVNRRLALAVVISPIFLLSKARKHFLTVGFRDQDGRQQAMVFRVGKGRVRSVLASLEARTGLRVQYQDDEARKAGKG